jgi:type II secretory pathway component PulF
MLSILEPILLISVGGLVGGLVLSMYLPIFSLMSKF